MLSFFTIPDASTVVSSSTDYASTLTTEFLPVLYVVVGIVAAVMLVKFLKKQIAGGIRGAAGVGGRRGRGRRR